MYFTQNYEKLRKKPLEHKSYLGFSLGQRNKNHSMQRCRCIDPSSSNKKPLQKTLIYRNVRITVTSYGNIGTSYE